MIMDYVRTFFIRQARFYPGDDRGDALIWYPAPVGAKPYPFVHRFGAIMNQKAPDQGNVIGEVFGSKMIYTKGIAPRLTTGTNFCGGELSFLEGALPLSQQRPKRTDGSYVCCDQPFLCQPFQGLLGDVTSTTPSWTNLGLDIFGALQYRHQFDVGPDTYTIRFFDAGGVRCTHNRTSAGAGLFKENFPQQQWNFTLLSISYQNTGAYLVPTNAPFWAGQTVSFTCPVDSP